MNSCVAFCSMFYPKVSYAFAPSASSPTATAPNYSLCAVLICRPVHHPHLRSALHISANSVIAAPCAYLRYSVHSSFLSGLMMRRKRGTLHDVLLLPDAFNIALQPVLV